MPNIPASAYLSGYRCPICDLASAAAAKLRNFPSERDGRLRGVSQKMDNWVLSYHDQPNNQPYTEDRL